MKDLYNRGATQCHYLYLDLVGIPNLYLNPKENRPGGFDLDIYFGLAF